MEILSVAVITALVEGVKQTTGLSGRFSFVLSLAFGIGVAVLVAASNSSLELASVVEGLLLGLGASGLYSGAVKPELAKRDVE